MTVSSVDTGAVLTAKQHSSKCALAQYSPSSAVEGSSACKLDSAGKPLVQPIQFVKEEERRRSDKDICEQLASELTKGMNAASPAELDEMCNNALRVQVDYHDEVRAIELYEQVVALDPKHVRALSCLGALYHKSGKLDAARKCYDSVLEQEPDRYKTVYNLGRLAHDLASHEEAQRCYERTLSLACDDTIACNASAFLGLLHQEVHRDYEKAQQCYEASLARNPKHLRTLDHQCALMVLTGRREEARAQHAQIVKVDPGHSDHMCAYLNSLFNGELLDSSTRCGQCSHEREWASWHGRPLTAPAFSASFSAPPAAPEPVVRSKSHSFLNRVGTKLKHIVPSRADGHGVISRKRVESFPYKSDRAVSNLDISTHSCGGVDVTTHGRSRRW